MGSEPPPYNKPFLLKRLIYRVQELAYGGLPMNVYQEMDRTLTEAGYDDLAATVNPAQVNKPASHRKRAAAEAYNRIILFTGATSYAET